VEERFEKKIMREMSGAGYGIDFRICGAGRSKVRNQQV
jgi:hypothetical protein